MPLDKIFIPFKRFFGKLMEISIAFQFSPQQIKLISQLEVGIGKMLKLDFGKVKDMLEV
jgi:hypothetical protein